MFDLSLLLIRKKGGKQIKIEFSSRNFFFLFLNLFFSKYIFLFYFIFLFFFFLKKILKLFLRLSILPEEVIAKEGVTFPNLT